MRKRLEGRGVGEYGETERFQLLITAEASSSVPFILAGPFYPDITLKQ